MDKNILTFYCCFDEFYYLYNLNNKLPYMGSWSVYCGISQIAITAGHDCVFLPLKKNNHSYGYYEYLPATLPIFGKYDDYGGIEEIIKDKNTALIEEYFGCTIDEFCHYFTRGCIRTDESDFPKKLLDNEELKAWKFMFIDRKVFDFMTTNIYNGFGGTGDFNFGMPDILELFGFKYIGENKKNPTYDQKRFKYEWEYNNKKFYSDGTWLYCGKHAIYNLQGGEETCLDYHIEFTEHHLSFKDKSMWQMWPYIKNDEKARQMILMVMGFSHSDCFMYREEKLNNQKYIEKLKEIELERKLSDLEKIDLMSDCIEKYSSIKGEYFKRFREFGDELAGLTTMTHNLAPMSGTFAPYLLYLTPQCGEYKHHQMLLNKFAHINNDYIVAAEDDE